MQIAIDGPVGSGKSTIARLLAKELSFRHIDTGTMYRALGYFAKEIGKDLDSEEEVLEALEKLVLDVQFINGQQEVFIEGKNVTDKLLSNEVGMWASKVSSFLPVRRDMVERQQKMAESGGVILDGRDIGTVVLPHADFKFYIDASPEIRARRRYEQLEEAGFSSNFDELLIDVKQRDYQDMNREHSPLKKAEDAIVIITDTMSIEEVLEKILKIIGEKRQ